MLCDRTLRVGGHERLIAERQLVIEARRPLELRQGRSGERRRGRTANFLNLDARDCDSVIVRAVTSLDRHIDGVFPFACGLVFQLEDAGAFVESQLGRIRTASLQDVREFLRAAVSLAWLRDVISTG